jgi:hypothetical protein
MTVCAKKMCQKATGVEPMQIQSSKDLHFSGQITNHSDKNVKFSQHSTAQHSTAQHSTAHTSLGMILTRASSLQE